MSSDPISTWEQRTLVAGHRMAQLGWMLHVTDQTEMPSGGVAWVATLAYRDRVVAVVEQHGAGGAPLIRWGVSGRLSVERVDPHPFHRDMWARDLTTAGVEEEDAVTGLDQVDVTTPTRESADQPGPAEVSLTLTFRVHDRDLLLDHAAQAVAVHGNGHVLARGDLGDAIAEVLLHSNPAVPGYLDHGIELVHQPTPATRLAGPQPSAASTTAQLGTPAGARADTGATR